MINYLFNNTNKPFITLLLIYSVASTSSLQAMDKSLHNVITIKNKNDDRLSSIQINYTQIEMRPFVQIDRLGRKTNLLKPNFVGMNTILNAAVEMKCSIAKNDDMSSLTIRDSHATIKNSYHRKRDLLYLNIKDNDVITLEARDNQNSIAVKQNDTIVGYIVSR